MHVRGKSGAEFSADSKKVLLASFRPCSYLGINTDIGGFFLWSPRIWVFWVWQPQIWVASAAQCPDMGGLK